MVLTAAAMACYAGGWWSAPDGPGYGFAENFLSDLGRLTAFSGRSNWLASALFAIAIASVGVALARFGWTWRGFAFGRGRARAAGIASALLATGSGAALVGVGLTPWDVALWPHNLLVVTAFGLLLGYAAALSLLVWRNAAGAALLACLLATLALIAGYVAFVFAGPAFNTDAGHRAQVLAQKAVAYGSMGMIIALTSLVRSRARR